MNQGVMMAPLSASSRCRDLLESLGMFRLLYCIILLLASGQSFARTTHPTFVWSRISKSLSFDQWLLRGQLQHRFEFERDTLYEEQVNLNLDYRAKWGVHSVLFTLGTVEGYRRKEEIRIALQSSWLMSLFDGVHNQFRLRIERRDLERSENVAYRFRLRNRLRFKNHRILGGEPELSGEFNFYINDSAEGRPGFSSHRTIVGLNYLLGDGRFQLAYLNDYRNEPLRDEMRHVIQLGLHF